MHLEERYFVPALFWNALGEMHYGGGAGFIAQLINRDLERGRGDLWHVKNALRRYFRSRKLALAELIVAREGA
jgi:hypothetical protein